MSKRIGKNAKRIRKITGLSQICIDLKPNRSVSDVYINRKMDVTELCKYMKKKKKSEDLTYFHAFATAIGKVIWNRPKMNYFVKNRHIWEHNDIVLSFVAKTGFSDKSEEIMVLLSITKDDTMFTIRDKIVKKVDSLRTKKVKKEGANSAISIVGKLPNIIRVPIVGLFKWCDKKGILPSGLVKDNIYYSSMIISNLGSIKCGAIYHNITDFGTASSLITMGEIHDEEVIINGKKEIRKICEWGMNFDERIADGYYFAKSAQMLQFVLDHPKMLEEPVATEIKMDELR